jgi:hypothetical protein
MRPLRILTWHVHGSYLYYLTAKSRHTFYVPSKPDRSGDYVGRWGHIPWGPNLVDVPVENVKDLELDCIIFQRPNQYTHDQFEILSDAQRRVPKIFIEHDTPWNDPTEQKHWVDDPNILLVHVTPFNQLMWNSGRTPTMVIDHGVIVPENVSYKGDMERGLVVINHLARRGRRLGLDVYERVRQSIPLDLVGMGADEAPGGLQEVRHAFLPDFESHYRFLFNPIRWTSMGLGVIEAMMCGIPIIGLATTEMAMAIENGVSGFVDTNVDTLIDRMRDLLKNPALARRLGEGARRRAMERFGIDRFMRDWDKALAFATGLTTSSDLVAMGGRS